MDIQQQPNETHSIQSYSDQSITIQDVEYTTPTLITPSCIIQEWSIASLHEISIAHFEKISLAECDMILIGHNRIGVYPPPKFIHAMGVQRIGVEWMSVGAACRTFNVLIGEGRAVAFGFIP